MAQSGRAAFEGLSSGAQVFHQHHYNSCPLVLIRPDPGTWVGGFAQGPDNFALTGSGSFDYVIFSHEMPGIPWGDGVGMQIFDEQGRLTFSSGYRFPRIQQIRQHSFSDVRQEIGTGVGPDSAGRRPWVEISDFGYSKWANTGEMTFYRFMYTLEMPGDGSTLIVGWRNATFLDLENYKDAKAYDVFTHRPMNIPVCHVPGV